MLGITIPTEIKGLPRLKQVKLNVEFLGALETNADSSIVLENSGTDTEFIQRNVLQRTVLIAGNEPIIELKLYSTLNLEAGDSIEILPPQDSTKVLKLMESQGYTEQKISINNGPVILVSKALSRLDFIPKKVFLRYLAEYSELKHELLFLSSIDGRISYEKYSRYDVLEFIHEFKIKDVPLSAFLEFLTPIKSRYYSVSRINTHETICICLKVLENGLCSNWLASSVSFVEYKKHDRKSEFKLQVGCNTLMIGNGTGIAPFVGLLEASGKDVKLRLLYGHRHLKDVLYEEILLEKAKKGLLQVTHAYSRLDFQPKTYCQDLLETVESEELFNWNIMICGGGVMGKQAEQRLMDIYCDRMQADLKDSAEFWQDRKASGKLLLDLW